MRLLVCVLLWGASAVSRDIGDDCLLSTFLNGPLYDSKYDTSGLQDSYQSGRQVRVSCVVGHSGFFKLICDNGLWKSRGSKCQPRSCGHPGDGQFSDFRLEGDDFVFGSKVIYTCNKGYQMVSRINYRRCVSEGWDGFVPVCEPIQCPLLRLDTGVLVIGKLEEANFGNVLRFSCKSSTQILNGSSEIFCDEKGQWSGHPPTCIDVICHAPAIENGLVVREDPEYPEHHVLDFKCNPGFKVSEGRSSKCTKIGSRAEWSPTPTCEVIRCKLDLSGTTGTTYEPKFTSVFSVRASVTITCGMDFWIVDRHTTSTVSTCQDDGMWSIKPRCFEVTCPNHRPSSVYWWQVYWGQRFTHGNRVRYQCSNSLKPTDDATELTCTRDGWKPDPPCYDSTCKTADVQNADAVDYSAVHVGQAARFVCRSGRKLQFTLKCTQQGWSSTHLCPGDDTLPLEDTPTQPPGPPPCPKPKVKNGFAVQTVGEVAYFTCHQGFKLLSGATWGLSECVNNMWGGLERCIDQRVCSEVPEVPNADLNVTTGEMEHQDLAVVTCRDGSIGATKHLTCLNGIWDSNGIPIQNICPNRAEPCGPPPHVKDAIITTPYKKEYLWDSKVTYRCRDKFTLEGRDWSQCRRGMWESSDIKCTAFCFKPEEEQPTMTFTPDQERYLPGEGLEYQCVAPENKKGGFATCVHGSWSQPIGCEAKPCGTPEDTPNGYYQVSETTVQYFCNDGFEMVSRVDTRTCLLGRWSDGVPVCEATTCDLPPLDEDMTVANLPEVENSVAPGHWLHFSCNLPGKVLNGSADLFCRPDGRWGTEFPTCEDVSCAVGKTDPRLRVSGLPTGHGAVRHGQKLSFDCDDGLFVDGAEEIECLQSGEWSKPVPSCSETCKLTDAGDDIQLESPERPASFRRGDKVKFRCRLRSHYLWGTRELECQLGGTWSAPFPTCGAHAVNCVSPPTLANGDVKDSLMSEYQHLQQVELVCQSYYIMEGGPMKTCFNGEWRGDMRCLKPCTVDRDAMNRHSITFRYIYDDKLYSTHNDMIEFICKRGRPSGNLRVRCVEGKIELPTCQ